eukprot:GDKI01003917.1.p1 GENE.GDKI01003917.1~~GDKI01003917.1.p1  ORF type:complete len:226 (-),score=66.99 GDKI01003917.1:253-930(-)
MSVFGMKFLTFWFTVSLFCLSCVGALQHADVRGTVVAPDNTPGFLSLCRVLLNGGEFEALPSVDGSFLIPNVPAGSYLLEVAHPTHAFGPVLVEVAERPDKAEAKVSAFLFAMDSGKGARLKYPVALTPSGAVTYFEKREEFSLAPMLKNPMVLIGLLSFGLMALSPKLKQWQEEAREDEVRQQEAEAARQQRRVQPAGSSSAARFIEGSPGGAQQRSAARQQQS